MSMETAENIIINAFKYATQSVNFAFQGGEPTLAGIEFFCLFIDKVNENNKNKVKVLYSIQTNGLKIDRDFAQFFSDNNFLVGLSIDGYKDIHDYFRIDSNNKPTHNKVMKTEIGRAHV